MEDFYWRCTETCVPLKGGISPYTKPLTLLRKFYQFVSQQFRESLSICFRAIYFQLSKKLFRAIYFQLSKKLAHCANPKVKMCWLLTE